MSKFRKGNTGKDILKEYYHTFGSGEVRVFELVAVSQPATEIQVWQLFQFLKCL